MGDQFAIYSTEYEWKGAPCASPLLLARRKSNTPIAIATVQQVEPDASYLTISNRNNDDPINLYDSVVVSNLAKTGAGKARAALQHSIKIDTVTSGKIYFTDGKGSQTLVDLVPYLKAQL